MLTAKEHATQEAIGLAPSESSVKLARDMVRDALKGWGFGDEVIYDSIVVTSELVSNGIQAVQDTDISLKVAMVGGRPYIAVWDASNEMPKACQFGEMSETGRGLFIVASLAEEYGVYKQVTGGKIIWVLMPGNKLVG